MLDSFPNPVATAPSDSPRVDAAPPGKAGGAAVIEVFTSFRSLVDALTDDADERASGSHGHGDVEEVPAGHGDTASDDEAAGRIVLPGDIAALLLSQIAPPQGPGGSGPLPAGAADAQGHHVFTAADLAALLLAEAGGPGAGARIATDAAATPGHDVVDLARDGAFAPGALVDAASAKDQAAEATLAQAIAQRLLALSAGSRLVSTTLSGEAGAASRNPVDELLRQLAQTSDRATGVNPASRSIGSFASALTHASATPMLAGGVGAASLPLEVPSAGTTDRIIQAIRLQWTKGGGEAQIRLEPRQFGDLTVSVSVNQGQVVARLQADTPIVREWLQANQQVLRQSLADQHLTLTRLEVSEPSANARRDGSRDGEAPPRDARRARRPRTPDTGETFDVVA